MTLITPPLNWTQKIEAIKATDTLFKRSADAGERAALRDAFGLLDVSRFEVAFEIRPWRKTGFRVVGTIDAEVGQTCVVTLEPIVQTVCEEIDVSYLPEAEALRMAQKMEEEGEIIVDVEAKDPPEAISGPDLEIGTMAAEHFALALDDYPRKADVAFEGDEAASKSDEEGAADEKPSPFAALAGHALAKKDPAKKAPPKKDDGEPS